MRLLVPQPSINGYRRKIDRLIRKVPLKCDRRIKCRGRPKAMALKQRNHCIIGTFQSVVQRSPAIGVRDQFIRLSVPVL